MKRLVGLLLIVWMLTGCAAKSAFQEGRALTADEQKEIAFDVLGFAAEVAIGTALWNNGHPDLSGQRPPDWWRGN